MRRTGLGFLVGLVVGLFAAGCLHAGSSAHDHAKSACDEYQHTARVQAATTLAQSSAIRDLARSDVRAAAAFDSRWTQLSSDMQRALNEQESMRMPPDATTLAHFFEIDKRVQDECSDAGRDIGDLKP